MAVNDWSHKHYFCHNLTNFPWRKVHNIFLFVKFPDNFIFSTNVKIIPVYSKLIYYF